MLIFVPPAAACDLAVLNALAAPELEVPAPAVATGKARQGGVDLAGANIVMRSQWGMTAWDKVLSRPEDEDNWLPAAFGTTRVERLDPSHIFQQKDIHAFFGAVHVRRQMVVGIDWLERSTTRLRNCWSAADPAAYDEALRPWSWEGVEMQRHALGGWDLHPLPDGGTYVSYQVWSDTTLLSPAVQARMMAGMLPDLMQAYEKRVGEGSAGP